jgi:hypothetical protein
MVGRIKIDRSKCPRAGVSDRPLAERRLRIESLQLIVRNSNSRPAKLRMMDPGNAVAPRAYAHPIAKTQTRPFAVSRRPDLWSIVVQDWSKLQFPMMITQCSALPALISPSPNDRSGSRAVLARTSTERQLIPQQRTESLQCGSRQVSANSFRSTYPVGVPRPQDSHFSARTSFRKSRTYALAWLLAAS